MEIAWEEIYLGYDVQAKKHGELSLPMSPRFGRDASDYDLHKKAGGMLLHTITAPNIHLSSKRRREVCKQTQKSNVPS